MIKEEPPSDQAENTDKVDKSAELDSRYLGANTDEKDEEVRVVNYDDDDEEDGECIFEATTPDKVPADSDNKAEESKEPKVDDSDENMATLNPALRNRLNNKYALFEEYLSFLDVPKT